MAFGKLFHLRKDCIHVPGINNIVHVAVPETWMNQTERGIVSREITGTHKVLVLWQITSPSPWTSPSPVIVSHSPLPIASP